VFVIKKIIAFMLAFLLILPTQSFASVNLSTYFDSTYHYYVVEYYKQITQRPGKFKLQFDDSVSNTHITKEYTDPQDVSGIFYLTCNGTYQFTFFDGNAVLINQSAAIVTTQTDNACTSYAADLDAYRFVKPYGGNTLSVVTETDVGGSALKVSWPDGNWHGYHVLRDGVEIANWASTDHGPYYYMSGWGGTPTPGTYSFCSENSGPPDCYDWIVTGDMITKNYFKTGDSVADAWAGNYSPGVPGSGTPGGALTGGGGVTPTPTPTPTCDGCQWIQTALACPEWSTYMGEFTTAFRAALPPPPDWDAIAEKIGTATINHLQQYYGPVPDPPTQADIDSGLVKTLPTINTGSPSSENLVPTVPAGYEQPKPFDISSGPQIPITDESTPFNILDPLHNITYDAPGVIVKPGNPTNNTGGINKPGTISGTIPKPTGSTTPAPSDPVPKPTKNPGSGAIPGGPTPPPPGSTPPTPTATPGSGPVPVYRP
jgi:hypothetical protein